MYRILGRPKGPQSSPSSTSKLEKLTSKPARSSVPALVEATAAEVPDSWEDIVVDVPPPPVASSGALHGEAASDAASPEGASGGYVLGSRGADDDAWLAQRNPGPDVEDGELYGEDASPGGSAGSSGASGETSGEGGDSTAAAAASASADEVPPSPAEGKEARGWPCGPEPWCDEPVVLVNLDSLCGFAVQPRDAPALAKRLTADLHGTPAEGGGRGSSGGAAFVGRVTELFDIGAAIHATRRAGPCFADDLLALARGAPLPRPLPPPPPEAEGGPRQPTWVAVGYPPSVEVDQGPLARDVSVPTHHLWRDLFSDPAKAAAAAATAASAAAFAGGDGDGDDGRPLPPPPPLLLPSTADRSLPHWRALGLVRQALRCCSQPLPWKAAMDGELVKLGLDAARRCEALRAERWAAQREARVDQLDEVRELLLAQQRSFEKRLAGVVAKRDALADAARGGGGGAFGPRAAKVATRASDTFAGFVELADDDGNVLRPAAAAAAAASGSADGLGGGSAAAQSVAAAALKADGEALALEEARLRHTLEHLSGKLDEVDDLYGLLLDEMDEEAADGGEGEGGKDGEDGEGFGGGGEGGEVGSDDEDEGDVDDDGEGGCDDGGEEGWGESGLCDGSSTGATRGNATTNRQRRKKGRAGGDSGGSGGGASVEGVDAATAAQVAHESSGDASGGGGASASLVEESPQPSPATVPEPPPPAAAATTAPPGGGRRPMRPGGSRAGVGRGARGGAGETAEERSTREAAEAAAAAAIEAAAEAAADAAANAASKAAAEAAADEAVAKAATTRRAVALSAAAAAAAAGAAVASLPSKAEPAALRLEVLDAVLAMVLGRLPRRPGLSDGDHFASVSALHGALRDAWAGGFGALAEDPRDWDLAPAAPPPAPLPRAASR